MRKIFEIEIISPVQIYIYEMYVLSTTDTGHLEYSDFEEGEYCVISDQLFRISLIHKTKIYTDAEKLKTSLEDFFETIFDFGQRGDKSVFLDRKELVDVFLSWLKEYLHKRAERVETTQIHYLKELNK